MHGKARQGKAKMHGNAASNINTLSLAVAAVVLGAMVLYLTHSNMTEVLCNLVPFVSFFILLAVVARFHV